MKRAMLLVGLLFAGCSGGGDGGFTGGGSVGDQCGPMLASLTKVPAGNPSLYASAYVDLSNGKTRVVLLPPGELDLRDCMLDWTGTGEEPSWILSVEAQELGQFDVAAGDARVWSAGDEATTGSVTIAGYNAEDDTVCGSVNATTPVGTITGVFSAQLYCD
jgi:hypothetical protein